MKKIFKHIALLIAALFIVSSTGVYLTIHYCSDEDITGLFFFTNLTEEPCEHHAPFNDDHNCSGNRGKYQTCDGKGNFCDNPRHHDGTYPLSAEMPECCSNTVLYIAIEDHFINTNPQALPLICSLLFPAFSTEMIVAAVNAGNLFTPPYQEPPPRLYGREITLLHRSLLL